MGKSKCIREWRFFFHWINRNGVIELLCLTENHIEWNKCIESVLRISLILENRGDNSFGKGLHYIWISWSMEQNFVIIYFASFSLINEENIKKTKKNIILEFRKLSWNFISIWSVIVWRQYWKHEIRFNLSLDFVNPVWFFFSAFIHFVAHAIYIFFKLNWNALNLNVTFIFNWNKFLHFSLSFVFFIWIIFFEGQQTHILFSNSFEKKATKQLTCTCSQQVKIKWK